jgi:hypothetical protein
MLKNSNIKRKKKNTKREKHTGRKNLQLNSKAERKKQRKTQGKKMHPE